MYKKITLCIMAGILLSACNINDKEETEKPIKLYNDVVDEKPFEFEGIKLNLDYEWIDKENLNLNIDVVNEDLNEIPFKLENENFLKISFLDKNKKLIKEKIVKIGDRNIIQPGEKINLEENFSFEEKYPEMKIKYELLFLESEEMYYIKDEISKERTIPGNRKNLTYLPNEKMRYVYKDFEIGKNINEDFKYFEEDMVQSLDSNGKTTIYKKTPSSLSIVYENDANKLTNNIINNIEIDEKPLLKFPVKVGESWYLDEDEFIIESNSETVETPYYNFTNVVLVKNIDEKIDYYIHHKIGIIQIIQDGKLKYRLEDIQNIK